RGQQPTVGGEGERPVLPGVRGESVARLEARHGRGVRVARFFPRFGSRSGATEREADGPKKGTRHGSRLSHRGAARGYWSPRRLDASCEILRPSAAARLSRRSGRTASAERSKGELSRIPATRSASGLARRATWIFAPFFASNPFFRAASSQNRRS